MRLLFYILCIVTCGMVCI